MRLRVRVRNKDPENVEYYEVINAPFMYLKHGLTMAFLGY
jgi:hypothetical protein